MEDLSVDWGTQECSVTQDLEGCRVPRAEVLVVLHPGVHDVSPSSVSQSSIALTTVWPLTDIVAIRAGRSSVASPRCSTRDRGRQWWWPEMVACTPPWLLGPVIGIYAVVGPIAPT